MCMIVFNQFIISYYSHKCPVLFFILEQFQKFHFSIASSFELRSLLAVVDLFLVSDLGIFGGIGKKGGYFGLGMGPIFCPW